MSRNIIIHHPTPLLLFQEFISKIIRTKQILKINQKYPHLPSGKFVNGDILNLFLKPNCFVSFGDINITIVFRGGHI
jgi:hypothetical protein